MRRLITTFSTTASNQAVGDTPLFVDPLCGADPQLQTGAFRFAARITQRAQTIGTYSHFSFARSATRTGHALPTPSGSDGH